MAQLGLAGERAGRTLSATALVREACLKLIGPREVAWAGRGHFYAAAAEEILPTTVGAVDGRPRNRAGSHRSQDGPFPEIRKESCRSMPSCVA